MGFRSARRSAAALFLLMMDCVACAANVSVDIEGVDGELLENVRANLEMQSYVGRDASPAQVRLLYDNAKQDIRDALQPFGYYHVKIQSGLTQASDGTFHAIFRIQRGEPVMVREVHVEVQGPGAEIEEVKAALERFQPKAHQRLQDQLYEQSKADVNAALRAAGFMDAELTRHEVAVTRAANTARMDVVWQSGERYHFGPVHFSESQFGEDFLRGYVPWQGSEDYSQDLLLDLQQRLVDADYFSVVSVQPEFGQSKDLEIPVQVLLVPDERTVYTAGLFMSTDSGPGGRLGMDRRWLNRRGHKAQVGLEYSQRLQEISSNYRIPQPGPFNRNYTIGAAYSDEATDSSHSRMARIGVAEARERWHGFNRTLGLQFLNSDFEIADESRSSSLLYAEAVLARKIADDALFALKGYSTTLGLRGSPGELLSDTNFLQLRTQGKWIHGFDTRQRVILRAELGAMTVGDFDKLPPQLRFFAGGDRSIRGFDYQQIGERNASGGVIGGKYLSLASAEYEYYFLPDWGAAVFVDAGDAFIDEFEPHAGAGFGVRWRSPVGLVRLDFADPIAGDLADGWRIHFVIGPDL